MGPLVLCLTLAFLQVCQVFGANNIPVFQDVSALDSRYLSEAFKVGETVGTIVAVDPDGTNVEYYILGDGDTYFAIGRTSGVVTLKKELEFDNRLSEREIVMEILVVDGDLQRNTFEGKVFVQDANDLKPYFERYDIFKTVAEDAKPGLFIADISVLDKDVKNDILSVECFGQSATFADACDKFDVRFNNSDISNKNWKGELYLRKPLDYETRDSYAILLLAKDGIFNETSEVHIEVKDINDQPPEWIKIAPVTIDEEYRQGLLITTVTAQDGDRTDPRDISYEIIDTVFDDGATFAINNVTGVISAASRLDFDDETHNKGQPYEVKVKAREVISKDPLVLGDDPVTTSTTIVSITIRDIDDNTPTFNKPEYSAFIPENIVTNGNIPGLQMTITDIDSGTFNSFDVVTLDFQDVFAVIPNSGKSNAGATLFIKDSEKIDYEKGPREYVIRLEARENQVVPALTGSAMVTIKVTDVNDESPRFSEETYTRSILETSGEGTPVIDLDAVDDEAGILGTAGIRYKLFGNQQDHFKIDEVTGAITVNECPSPAVPGTFPCIDFERKAQYVLTVSATDYNGQLNKGRTRSVQVIVTIIDENDNIPTPQKAYTAYIYEEETEPVQPLIIKAEDPDSVGGPVTYELKGASDIIANWKIDETTDAEGAYIGIITATRPILYSDAQNPADGSIRFEVLSKDKKYSTLSQVTIFILDINNNAPEFSIPSYEETIKEDTPGDVFIITVTATDGDAPTTGNGLVDFSISSGAVGKFTVKSTRRDGEKFLADIYTTPDATFNYNLNDRYEMTLVARDQGTPESKRGTAKLIVNILDINNNDPQITPTSVSISVPENRVPNSDVHQVIALDPDNTADLRYYMFPKRAQNPTGGAVDKNLYNYEELFRIEENTGIVRVNKPLNREQTSFLVSDLRVVDVAATPPQTGTGALFITITEVNDQDPVFDLPFYNITIDEELNINFFVRNLHCTDEDDQIASYSLVQTQPRNPNFFTLMDNSGSLIVANRIDFEALEEIKLVATCFDDGTPQRSGKTDIDIIIRNINDNSPEFLQPLYQAQIAENNADIEIGGTEIATVSATDIDKGDYGIVRYRMYKSTDPFNIDELTGVITIKNGTIFDREKSSSYGFQVIAYDSPNTPSKRKETTVPVYLTIQDVNDHCPTFSERVYSGSIPENAKTGTDIIDVIADDKDYGINKRLTFSVQDGSFEPTEGFGYFDISPRSGRIYTRSTLSGKSGTYRFNVTATDTNGQLPAVMCSSHVPVVVTVSQSQNYAPRWIDPPVRDFVIYVLESQYEGMLVYDSKAEDLDAGRSGVIDYYFVEGKKHVAATKEFRINQVTGIIRAEIEFDRENIDRYFLTLVAVDQGATKASSETTLIVVILDVDDNDPVFTKNGVVEPLLLPENPIREDDDLNGQKRKVGQCAATDADSDAKNNKIFYEIITAEDDVRESVEVDRETCEIYLTKQIDYEKRHQLEFNIFAFNEKNDDSVIRHKRAVNPSIQPVIIRIGDVNDNKPAFTESEYFACAPLASPYLSSIIDLDAHDVEAADIELNYDLPNNNNFNIDKQGIIHNVISFPSTPQRIFDFQANVDDSDFTTSATVNIFVTQDSTQAMLTVNRPSSDVRRIKQEYEHLVEQSSSEIRYACAEVRNHINDDGSVSSSKSDVFISVAYWDGQQYQLWSGSRVSSHLSSHRSNNPQKYESFFISSISTVDDDDFGLDEDVVLAILIVTVILIVLAILLFILACYCIWAKKKKKVRKVKAQRHTIAQNAPPHPQERFDNPVYHNSGYVAYEDEYSTVNKSRKDVGPINPVVIPAPENLQPLSTFQPVDLEPVSQPEPEPEPTPPEIPEPVIETEVLPEEAPEIPPYAPNLMEPEYEDRIETVVEDGGHIDYDGGDDDELPLPDLDYPVDEEEIETEIRDDTPPTSPDPPY